MEVVVTDDIEKVCPGFVGACVEAKVTNSQYCKPLWDEIESMGDHYRETLTTESLKEIRHSRHTPRLQGLWQRSVALPPCR